MGSKFLKRLGAEIRVTIGLKINPMVRSMLGWPPYIHGPTADILGYFEVEVMGGIHHAFRWR